MVKILYIGPTWLGSTGLAFRNAFVELGATVQTVDTHLAPPASLRDRIQYRLRGRRYPEPVIQALNQKIVQAAESFQPDLTLFIHLPSILPETLQQTHRYGLNFCWFPDDMFNPSNQSFTFYDAIKGIDCIFTTKSYNVAEFHTAGAPLAIFVHNAYDPLCQSRVTLSEADQQRYGGDVAFIGTFRPERADFLSQVIMACPGVRFNIWGGGWHKLTRRMYRLKPGRWKNWQHLQAYLHPNELFCDEMSKAFVGNKISLGLLYAANRDRQTHRTMEIPASGGFMLAERSDEHQALFTEDQEAAYFSTFDELIQKIHYYLAHPDERARIAQAGWERCQQSEYRYSDRAQLMLDQYQQMRQDRDQRQPSLQPDAAPSKP